MSRPLIGILVCGNVSDAIAASHGTYDVWFRDLLKDQGLDFRVWRVVDGDIPGDVHDADGWLLTGSPLGVYEDHAFLPPLRQFVRDAVAAGVRVTGICFGHQLVAQALGARVEKFDGGWRLGSQSYSIDGLGEVTLNAWHQDQVLELPEGTEVIARSTGCAIAGFRMGDTVLTLQPHPEMTDACLSGLRDSRIGNPAYPPELLAATHPAGVTGDVTRTADWLGAFLRG